VGHIGVERLGDSPGLLSLGVPLFNRNGEEGAQRGVVRNVLACILITGPRWLTPGEQSRVGLTQDEIDLG
jgi:hypothetical protein